jgi:hypothetical protein
MSREGYGTDMVIGVDDFIIPMTQETKENEDVQARAGC